MSKILFFENATNDAKISPISTGPNETAYDLDITAQEWTSFDIPLSFFTDQNPLVDFSQIIQFKLEGAPTGGAIFVDNLNAFKFINIIIKDSYYGS
mgnify:CR=1 FL=1